MDPSQPLSLADDAEEAADRFSGFIDRALDVWSEAGFDRRRGLFAERLDLEGRLIPEAPCRAMVQARQIYVFCDAARRSPRFGELALQTMDRTLGAYMAPGFASGCAFSLAPDGGVASGRQDAYTHAFVLFALASCYRLSREPLYLAAADGLSRFLWAHLGDEDAGGVYSDDASRGAGKAQNPHMHLLEAYLALYEASGAERYLERARSIARLFARNMFRADLDVLPEGFARDWAPACGGASFEPGHHFEWIWLLAKFDSASGEDHGDYRDRLWRTALRCGRDERGRCFDEVALSDFAPTRSIRLWPHCEGVKAALAMARAPEAPELLASMLRGIDVFVDRPFPGGWIDRYDENGEPAVGFVPASSLYHLYLAYAELAAVRRGGA